MHKSLNLGCGSITYEEYPEGTGLKCTNVDLRELPGVDIVADVTDLSMFNMREFDYILASDIIEHFPVKYTQSIIAHWSNLLKEGGTIEFRTPNLKWVAEHYLKHKDTSFASFHIFGGQDYEGNYHYVIFDEPWLTSICRTCGLELRQCKEEGSNFIAKYERVR